MQRGNVGYPFPTGKNPVSSTGAGTPFTGIFGGGNLLMVPTTLTWVVPVGVYKARFRVWSGGGTANGTQAGGGGAFAMKVLDVTPGQSIVLTVGAADATSSVGSFVTCTGGANTGAAGTATGGDINNNGGTGGAAGGGGAVGNLFGVGGKGATASVPALSQGSGGGAAPGGNGANGHTGVGGLAQSAAKALNVSDLLPINLDTIGAGPGGGGGTVNSGVSTQGSEGWNGGGGGATSSGSGGPVAGNGGFPGGGAGSNNGGTPGANAVGARGLISVEY
jgi:hypothetical protein